MTRGRQRPGKRSLAASEVGVVAFAGYAAWTNPDWRPWIILMAVCGMAVMLLWAIGRRRRGRWSRTGRDLYRLSPAEFEEAVASILRRNGWKDVKVQGGSGDLGADVIGTDPDGRRVVVQAKRYAASNKVGSQEVQVLIGSQRIHRADRAMIVTTSGYTAAAVELAGEFGDVDLIDGQALGRLAA